jgi:hypothetical protein
MSVDAQNEARGAESWERTGLPRGGEIASETGADAADGERNTIFDSLVRVEGEVAGLVAYSIYKQNKRAWLQDFIKSTGRPPNEAEARAYIIGESTERRLATYRHLAAATLAGQGPDAPASGMRALRTAPGRTASFYLIWAVVLIAAVGVVAYAVHVGLGAGK